MYQKKLPYISQEILLFVQNLVVHFQLVAQVGNVLFKSLVGFPGTKQTYEPTYFQKMGCG